ncbi:NADP-dependent oxidoreductase [Streptomyces sp. NPDC006476]|uniref:NADP-dependent oxidoreductase n=1 Tax=Streptomyces sp. NPDC006476 TaxID=3157175 RepID=UPI0033AB7592
MKAVYFRRFGGPEVLEFDELPDPTLGPHGVLVRTRAAAVNPLDWKAREGLLAPLADAVFPVVGGFDVAGTVERVGVSVTEFAPGDEVLGYVWQDVVRSGTFAELVVAPARTLVRKPAGLTWEEAAALPLAGLAAYQSVAHRLRVRRGEAVLVHAAAGGVGLFAVQLARLRGAEVIGTAGEHNHDFLRALGVRPVAHGSGLAERVRQFAPDGVDAVLDAVGRRALRASRELLRPGGRLVSLVEPRVTELGGSYLFARPDAADLTELARLAAERELAVEVARTFPLEQAAQAQQLLREGHTRGKLVLSVGG